MISSEDSDISQNMNGNNGVKCDEKKMKRILANRKSAKASYLRRKRVSSALETTITQLKKDNEVLVDENNKLRQQKMLLEQQLSLSILPNHPTQIPSNAPEGSNLDMQNMALQQLAAQHLQQQHHQHHQHQLLQNRNVPHHQQSPFLQTLPQQIQDFQRQQLMQAAGAQPSDALTSAAPKPMFQSQNQDVDKLILEMMLKQGKTTASEDVSGLSQAPMPRGLHPEHQKAMDMLFKHQGKDSKGKSADPDA
mmetsp:Transcript_11082/g.16997  ORF Transcript_11082/g.16997 Transcript_11082/m.16997 type:complete len:250 (+) Transcript_11082:114-863(+)